MRLRKHDYSSDLRVPVPRALAGASPSASSPQHPSLESGTWARSRHPQPHPREAEPPGISCAPSDLRPRVPGRALWGHTDLQTDPSCSSSPPSPLPAASPLFRSPTPPRRLRYPPPGPVIPQPRPRYPPWRWAGSPRASRGRRRPLPRSPAGVRGPRAGQGRAASAPLPRPGRPREEVLLSVSGEGRAGRPEEAAPRTLGPEREAEAQAEGRRRGRLRAL